MAEHTVPPDSSGFDIELLLKQARTYLAFGEQLQPLSERFYETLGQDGDWGEALRQHFDQLKATLAEAVAASADERQQVYRWLFRTRAKGHAWKVYGREGEPCPGCPGGAACAGVARIVQAGRSTFYCPRRQR